jgi:hypothetical protein
MPPRPPGEAFRRLDHPLRIDTELLVLEPIDGVFSRVHRFSNAASSTSEDGIVDWVVVFMSGESVKMIV